jgi:molybdenum cofactor biosynthesis protein B
MLLKIDIAERFLPRAGGWVKPAGSAAMAGMAGPDRRGRLVAALRSRGQRVAGPTCDLRACNNARVSVAEHKRHAPAARSVRVAVITVSDTRTETTDEGGRLVRELCQGAGFSVVSAGILRDDPVDVAGRVNALCAAGDADAILLTGGTGLSRRDTTVEAVAALFDKTIDGYGELFRALSFAEIGAAAMLSRATAGTIGEVAVFTMPGSPGGVRLALDKLILPELGHVVAELQRHAPHGHAPEHGPHDHEEHGHGHRHG